MVKGWTVLVAAVAAAGSVIGAPSAPADPGTCQFLGANYNVDYPCTQYQPWLPFGTGDNPPYGSPLPPADCAPPNQHNVGCS